MTQKQPEEDGDEWEEIETNGDTAKCNAHKFMMEQSRKAALRGDPVASAMLDLENLASPFYLGNDELEDEGLL